MAARLRVNGFQVAIVVIGVLVAGTVLIALGRLAVWAWDDYGTGIPDFYASDVFGDAAVRRMLLNTAIVVVVSSTLATFVAAVLAWLNERTDASIGAVGRVLPLIPFMMPAIALPLGWLFLATPTAGGLNILLRDLLGIVGIDLERGPLDIYSWPGLVFLYTVFLCGFAYLVLSSSMRTLDRGLEEAARLAGAGPVKILFRIVLPAQRPALFSGFLMCVIVAVVMVSVPITVGAGANIPILSVELVNLVTTQSPPAYGRAFLLGLLLLVPILLAWWLQHRTAARGRFAVIGGRASASAKMALGTWGRRGGRLIFGGYIFVAVVLPLVGLVYVAGQSFWSNSWPKRWNPWTNMEAALNDTVTRRAIVTSVVLGLSVGAVLVLISHLLAYGQRLFPRLGRIVDLLTKTPAIVAQILVAIALLVTLGASPFGLEPRWLLFIGYIVVFLPFASVLTTGAQQQIGRDVIEAARVANASDMRTFLSIVTPLARPALVASFLLMYVLVSGETNVSLILASTQEPVVGFVMLDLFNFASFPKVAGFALVITLVNLACIGIVMRLLSGRR